MATLGLTRPLVGKLGRISIKQARFAPFLLILAIVSGLYNLVQGQGFLYSTNNGTVTITGYNGPNGDVIIPATLEGLTVTSIGPNAFYQRNVASVVIPDTVTNIGEHAFDGCFFLNHAIIPDGVHSIGDYSFYQCFRMTNLTIGAGLTNIGNYAFVGCLGLLAIDVNSNNPVFYSSNGVLFDLIQAKLLLFPPGVVGTYTIPSTTKIIGFQAFLQCSGLTNIYLPNGITNIEDEAFDQCSALNSIQIPDTVPTLGKLVFNYCYNLTSADLGNGVVSLGVDIFQNCVSLTNVTIGSALTNLPVAWVNGCANLMVITVNPLNPIYSSMDGVLFSKDQTTLILCPPRKAGIYDIPITVTSIGTAAFGYCTNLTGVTIPGSVTNIASSAFYSCANLTSLTIASSVANIGTSAFSMCTSLTNVTIGPNVLYLPAQLFSSCYNLTGVHFEGDQPFVDSSAFAYDNNVVVYYVPGTIGWGSTFNAFPTKTWTMPSPTILNNASSFGMLKGLFGFDLMWADGMVVVLEACTNLTHPIWTPLQTNTLASGPVHFGDDTSINYSTRFYRFRSLFPTNPPPVGTFKTLHNFTGGWDGGILFGGVALSGNVLYGTTTIGGPFGSGGTLFTVNTDGSGFTNLYGFGNWPGGVPECSLTVSGNNVYGTTAAQPGTIFTLNTDGSDYTNLYAFSPIYATVAPYTNSDGQSPYAGVILSGSTLFGRTSRGGTDGNGTVFRINTDGSSFTNLCNLPGPDIGFDEAGLVLVGGTLYGTTSYGGSSSNGMVFALGTNGTGFTNLYSFTGGSDGRNPYASLAFSSNSLYGTTVGGGVWNAGSIFTIHTDGTGFTNLYSFTGGNDGSTPVAGLVVSGTTIYGAASGAGRWGNGTIFSVHIDGTGFVLLHSFSPQVNGNPPINDGGVTPNGSLILSGNTLYGTTQWAGKSGYGTVFSISLPSQ